NAHRPGIDVNLPPPGPRRGPRDPSAWASPRLPSAEDLASAYVDRSGRDLGDWGFYLGLAHLKLAVIAEGIAYRAMTGADAGRNARAAADAVPELVAAVPACLAALMAPSAAAERDHGRPSW